MKCQNNVYICVQMSNEDLLNFYYYGFEVGQNGMKFPDWFQYGYEKIACLIGYNDFELGLIRDKEEILKEIKERIK